LKKFPFKPYDGTAPYLYIIHAPEDAALVAKVALPLSKKYNIWYDDGTAPKEASVRIISDKIENAAVVLYFVSSNSVISDYAVSELVFAKNRGCKIIPICLPKANLPEDFKAKVDESRILFINKISSKSIKNLEMIIDYVRGNQ